MSVKAVGLLNEIIWLENMKELMIFNILKEEIWFSRRDKVTVS